MFDECRRRDNLPCCRRGTLAHGKLKDWIDRTGQFALQHNASTDINESNVTRIRLLMCERTAWPKLGFPVSQACFLELERVFDFPKATLPLILAIRGWSSIT
ncbi:hypothetical protein BKA67DRAFT_145219 [Truncatella angustata]|uniref:Uncharacterized protein n=1 Tax=Truncatella angustata TaxID=152316 RepID=A0A9P8UBD3_9PEZI|nr:uncharacterized protein BKA67DRAFT_145219 [Truncatella angustata]KAH6638619.1 hypothetical protein BKA67DRAFT_145219 [Truncatella angustata]